MKVEVESGKYTYVMNDQGSQVLRYGEPWKDATGDKFIYCMAAEIESLRAQLAAAQAKIDSLMLEYCPDEMTPEQLDEWAKHQRPVDAATQEAISQTLDAARKEGE